MSEGVLIIFAWITSMIACVMLGYELRVVMECKVRERRRKKEQNAGKIHEYNCRCVIYPIFKESVHHNGKEGDV